MRRPCAFRVILPEPCIPCLEICGWLLFELGLMHVFVTTNLVDATMAVLTPLFKLTKGRSAGIHPSSSQQKRIILGSVAHYKCQQFSENVSIILTGLFAWQVQHFVMFEVGLQFHLSSGSITKVILRGRCSIS